MLIANVYSSYYMFTIPNNMTEFNLRFCEINSWEFTLRFLIHSLFRDANLVVHYVLVITENFLFDSEM